MINNVNDVIGLSYDIGPSLIGKVGWGLVLHFHNFHVLEACFATVEIRGDTARGD